jgi:SET domain-containing protein
MRSASNLRTARFRLIVRRSKIHRWGVFAAEPIPARKKVIEYTGERITWRKALERQNEQRISGQEMKVYFFRLSRNWQIDGAVGGSGAEFVNHSCDPNLVVRRIRGHIFFFSRKAIPAKVELTLNYRFPKNVEKVACHCGSPKCRGVINRS